MFLGELFFAPEFAMTRFIRDQLQDVILRTTATMSLVFYGVEEAVYRAHKILPFTRRPVRSDAVVLFDAARPRTTATLCNPPFIRTKARTLEMFQRAVGT